MKKNIENIEAIGVERDLAGLPMAFVPPDLLSVGASQDQKNLLAEIKKIVTNVRRDEQEGIVFPAAYDPISGKPLFDFKLLSTGGSRQFDTDKIIQRYDQRIAISALADFVLLGQGTATGSWAMHSDKTKLFSMAMGAFLDIIADTINRFAVTRLFSLNDFKISDFPKIVHGDMESVDLKDIGDYIQKLAAAGMPLFPNEELEKHLMKVANMPELVDPLKQVDQQVESKHVETPDSIKEIPDSPIQKPTGLDIQADTTPVNNKPPVSVVTNSSGNTERTGKTGWYKDQSPSQFTDWNKW